MKNFLLARLAVNMHSGNRLSQIRSLLTRARQSILTMSIAILTTFVGVEKVWGTNFTLSSASNVTIDGITASFAKSDGSTAPAWYSAGLRLYAKNTITISSSSNITAISFNWEKQGDKAFATATASTGTYSHPTKAGEGTWTGSATSITFTLGSSGQLQLNTFTVTAAGSSKTFLLLIH